MINVCDEKDCFLHNENEWRAQAIKGYEKTIEEMDNPGNKHSLQLLFSRFINLYEGNMIPVQCMNCMYRKPRDMKVETMAEFAKNELLK